MIFKEAESIIKNDGYVLIRTSGLFKQYQKVGFPTITIPDYGRKDLTIEVLKSLKNITDFSLPR
mgnify:CR=1 FL=1|jgi:predicted RNA binding protein YcfA (HicA-like mRNA interferase family)